MMRFIVAHKQINLPKLIVVAFSAMLALASCRDIHLELATEKQLQSSGRTFADGCRQKSALSPEAQHTIEVLLKEAETTDCNVANQKLSILTDLNLYNKKISDLKPLKSMTKLEYLELDQNQISDIKPLQSLTNLKRIDLRYSNPCTSRKFFTPPQPSPNPRSGSKKFTNDLGWL